MSAPQPTLSLVFPVFNEEENLRDLFAQVGDVIRTTGTSYELVFVDNGSTDESLALIKAFAERDASVRYVSLSRNFGHQGGLFAGLSHSRGRAVIMMDADLQHPPQLIPQMVALWKQGYEVVYTKKRHYGISAFRRVQMKMFYWIISKLSALQLSFGQSDFRLVDRKVVDVLLNIPEYRKFLRGLVEWVGFRQTSLEYDVAPRRAGRSKFSYRTLLSFAADGILAFSFLPLRWSLAIGVLMALLCFAYGILTVILGILQLMGAQWMLPPGWATLTAAVLFLGSVQLIAIGVLSEYVGRVYEQIKGRPPFIVREVSRDE